MRGAWMLGLAALAGAAAPADAQRTLPGPDLVVATVTDARYFATVGAYSAYSLGSDACNFGDQPLSWDGSTGNHPVLIQNIYRLKNNRFVHIGQAWAKHGHSSANANNCATCQQPPGGSLQLGIGCSDTYAAGLNGFQILMGPRSQVNATTGDFPYPFTAPGITSDLDRRIRVAVSDVIDSNNPGALYFGEVQYISAEDARARNGLNNASWQQIAFPDTSSNPVLIGPTHQMQPAITAWQAADPSVVLVTAEYDDSSAGVGIPARFWVGARASDNGNGTWHYEYAVYNMNADRGAGTFSVPVSGQVSVSNFGFHAPLSHSGEPYSNDVWSSGVDGDTVRFWTVDFNDDPNANAIRWGTLYNFRFDASAPPTTGTGTLGLFKPGSPDSLDIPGIPIPTPGNPPPACYANCDNSTDPPVLNVADFTCFLDRFFAADPWANCDGSTTDPVFNILDFTCFLRRFASGCP
jgi:hypothetical protein